MTWKHIVMGVCGFVLGFWACIPRDMPLENRWEVLVQDTAGHGLPQAEVFQTRYDYATGAGRSETLQRVDSYGRAAFPAVGAHTSPLLRMIVCARVKLSGTKAACGFSQVITVSADGFKEVTRQAETLPLKGRGQLLTVQLQETHN